MDMAAAGDEEATITLEESTVDGCVKLLTNVPELAEERYRSLSQNPVRIMLLGSEGAVDAPVTVWKTTAVSVTGVPILAKRGVTRVP